MSAWILCRKRKPEEYSLIDLEVTTCDREREVAFYYVEQDKWFDPTTMNEVEVIAWRKPSKPYGTEKDLITFKDRVQLVKEYEQWLADNPEIKDCPLSFCTFLNGKGVIHLE